MKRLALTALVSLLACRRCPLWRRPPRSPTRRPPASPAPSACRPSSTASSSSSRSSRPWRPASSSTRRAPCSPRPRSPTGVFSYAAPDRVRWEYQSPSPITVVIRGEQMTTWYRDLKRADLVKVGRYSNQVLKYLGASGNMQTLLDYFNVKLAMPDKKGEPLPHGAGAALRPHPEAPQVDDPVDRPRAVLPRAPASTSRPTATSPSTSSATSRRTPPSPGDRFVLKLPKEVQTRVIDLGEGGKAARTPRTRRLRQAVSQPLSFEVLATCGRARRGRLTTPHGVVETPAFMPVGTLGAVKGVTPQELAAAGASIHALQPLSPGAAAGDRHRSSDSAASTRFTGWDGPILTDSGGFQVFSLSGLRKVDDGGVTFRSHLDGSPLRFTPEGVVDMQERMGVDVAMVLDECPPWPIERERRRPPGSAPWPGRAGRGRLAGRDAGRRAVRHRPGERLPGPARSAPRRSLAELDFDGYAIGGVSVGEPDAGPPRRRRVDRPGAAGGPAALPDGRRLPRGHPARRRRRGWTSSTACCRRATPGTACCSPATACSRSRTRATRTTRGRSIRSAAARPARARLAGLPAPPDALRRAHRGGARDPAQPALLP